MKIIHSLRCCHHCLWLKKIWHKHDVLVTFLFVLHSILLCALLTFLCITTKVERCCSTIHELLSSMKHK